MAALGKAGTLSEICLYTNIFARTFFSISVDNKFWLTSCIRMECRYDVYNWETCFSSLFTCNETHETGFLRQLLKLNTGN